MMANQGALHWMRRNLFSTPFNSILTLLSVTALVALIIPLLQWAVFDAAWRGTDPESCRVASGACWPFVRVRFDQFMYGLYPLAERWRVDLGVGVGFLLAGMMLWPRFPGKFWIGLSLLTVYPVAAIILFGGGLFGLVPVSTNAWGGFFLTLVVSTFVLTLSLPFGVLLALGRQSKLPLVRFLAVGWIEFWRAVPVLVLLFVVIIMFPLFMPPGFEVDKLLRALIALTILMSCYIAEAVRGALQSLPRGQYEAAEALGLSYPQAMLRVILPQALTLSVPQITSIFIGLFKETTVLLIIGFFDLLGMVQTASTDPRWMSASTVATGYLFAALFFWVCCFAMSRYSARLETKYRQTR
ncbi:amino acid ABC transporter permease [Govanella unica]|uniref:Amino acid ABC transporter permease n=1 Tax=Govanella unica TaxID=2975056 RepID=A0A9X3TVB4_9PROT|nr:amino acid ABC transporter permease [Govania unica]MDA5192681.1 amino acid ABC transporter permease [Govania unica]